MNEKNKVRHNHGKLYKVILTDYFDFDWLKREEDIVMFKVLSVEKARELVHNDMYEVYSCVTDAKMKKLLETYLTIEIPLASKDECEKIDPNEFENHVAILAPELSKYDLEKDEKELDSIFCCKELKFVFINLARQICT